MLEYGGLWGLVVLIADVWAVVNIIQSSASTGTKVLWIVIVAVLPSYRSHPLVLHGPKDREELARDVTHRQIRERAARAPGCMVDRPRDRAARSARVAPGERVAGGRGRRVGGDLSLGSAVADHVHADFPFSSLHAIGAHWTYSEVPYDRWRAWLTGPRSTSGRLGAQQLRSRRAFFLRPVAGLSIREVFLRVANVRGFWGYFLPLDLTMSTSMITS